MKKCMFLIPRMGGGGAERVMATIANNLCQDNEIEIVSLTDGESFYALDERVKITGLGQTVNRSNKITLIVSMAVGGIKSFFALKKKIKAEKPDVILSFLREPNLFALVFKMLGIIKCRLVVSERNDPTKAGRLGRWFEKSFYHKADTVVCQSERVIEFFKKKHREKMVVIPNPVAADAIPPRFEGERRHTIVGVGRLSEQKNFPMLISAFARLDERFADYTLEIYGGGPLEDKLNDKIRALGLENRAALMGVKKNVMHYISDAALYVMSSDYEGFPNALAEAMATGLPVISTDFSTGVARDIIKEENGIVIPVGDEDALVSAMETMLSDCDNWNNMSLANRKLLDTLSEKNIMVMWKDVLSLES